MSKSLHILKYFFWTILFLTLFIRGIVFLDPDFGWRLRSGELILRQGIPKEDPFTYSMPSYPWINHAWGTDVIIAALYPIVGTVGLSILFTILTVTTVYIIYTLIIKADVKVNKNPKINSWYLAAPILMLTAASFFRYFGIRAQVWTWLFVAIVFKLLLDRELWFKWRFTLPIVFLLWVNFHGGFPAGLLTFIFVISIRIIKDRKIDLTDVFLILVSILVTFVNPYGMGIYKEVWDTLTDRVNHKNILEWNNYFKSFNIPSLFLITLSSLVVYGQRRKLKLEEIGLYVFFLYQAIMAVRQVPLWAMIAFYGSYKAIRDFYINLKEKIAYLRFSEIYKIFYILASVIFVTEMVLAYLGALFYSERYFYPVKGVEFIKQNIPEKEIFSKYDYGGYLIWKLPEKKVFIDGRMPFWYRTESREGESLSAMNEYMDLLRGEANYRDLFKKYNVELVLWSNTSGEGLQNFEEKYLQNFQFLYKLLGVEKQEFSLIEDLKNDGWTQVYTDDVSVIYRKHQ